MSASGKAPASLWRNGEVVATTFRARRERRAGTPTRRMTVRQSPAGGEAGASLNGVVRQEAPP